MVLDRRRYQLAFRFRIILGSPHLVPTGKDLSNWWHHPQSLLRAQRCTEAVRHATIFTYHERTVPYHRYFQSLAGIDMHLLSIQQHLQGFLSIPLRWNVYAHYFSNFLGSISICYFSIHWQKFPVTSQTVIKAAADTNRQSRPQSAILYKRTVRSPHT